MKINDLVQGARSRLIDAGISANLATLDAELLARQVLGWDQARFLIGRDEPASSAFLLNYEHFVARRLRREPISYIIGTREFWGLEFQVTPDVLIPRPETELIVEEALDRRAIIEAAPDPLVIDVGTGSGILAVVLAKEFPRARVIATDISSRAIAVAKRNAARHEVGDRITFVETSFLDGIDDKADLIVSNPPYVPDPSGPALTPEVRDYEPPEAVFAGDDGLEGLKRVIGDSARLLKPNGTLIVEFGYGQEDAVAEIVTAASLAMSGVRNDLQGIPRTAIVCRFGGPGR